jgi:sulfur relay (sulfurtransferase) complex TusBCD TusD component (DsrE family)
MIFARHVVLVFTLGMLALGSAAATAGPEGEPLFVNLLSGPASHRSDMALTFTENVLKRGHPVTVFLNDEGVKIAVKSSSEAAKGRDALERLMKGGATVIACPYCMKHYGVRESDLLEGVKVGNPELTQGELFRANTRTLTW